MSLGRDSLFFKQEMELALVGLQNAGKTSFVNVVATGSFNEDMIPTVGFNMRKVSKGKVSIKLWDLGGQPRFRSMWERYCRGVNAVVYVVDAADHAGANMAKSELHELLNKPTLAGIPLLVLGNKNDLPGAMTVGTRPTNKPRHDARTTPGSSSACTYLPPARA